MIDLQFHSPVEQIQHPLFAEKGIEVFIKRDDLIHPLISGNKWRKLKYLLRKIEEEGKSRLVTFGGAWSNHLLATACAAAKFGLQSTGIVRGEEVENDVLFFCKLFGMKLIFVERESYRDKKALFESLFSNDPTAFFIDEGGNSYEGTLGCAEIIDELPEVYDHIFSACGTGTTAAGIINGINKNRLKTRFHGIPVLKGGEFLRPDIEKYLDTTSGFEHHTNYHFSGYAKTTPELLQFIQQFSSTTGILIDPVYTGKMLYALFDLAEKDYFNKNDKVLAVHTGGLFGLLGMKSRFDFLQ